MWLFLSRRLRAWAFFTVAVPVAGAVVHRLAERAQRSDPSSTASRALARVDRSVHSVRGRRARE